MHFFQSDSDRSGKQFTRREMIFAAGAVAATARFGMAQARPAPEEIIDIHAHIISQDVAKYPATPFAGQQSTFSKERPETFEEYVQQADSAGITKAAIVQVSTFYGINDAYLADSVAKNPKRFIGICSIDTIAPDAVQVLDGWRKRGLTGLRIFTLPGDKTILISPKAEPVWDYVVQHKMTVCISTVDIEQLRYLVKKYPSVKIVLDHTDFLKLDEGPPYSSGQAFFDMAQYPNLYLKITPKTLSSSSGGSSTSQAFIQKLVSVYGANRMAFGSDLPSAEGPMTRIVADMMKAFSPLSPADRSMILSGTAKVLYPALA